jgi:immune inhibitor A
MAIHNCADGPCHAPPHPDLIARLGFESFRAQASPKDSDTTRTAPLLLSAPTGTVAGLNDGTIFPESHFEGAPSSSELSRAALERAPLRGVTRFVNCGIKCMS